MIKIKDKSALNGTAKGYEYSKSDLGENNSGGTVESMYTNNISKPYGDSLNDTCYANTNKGKLVDLYFYKNVEKNSWKNYDINHYANFPTNMWLVMKDMDKMEFGYTNNLTTKMNSLTNAAMGFVQKGATALETVNTIRNDISNKGPRTQGKWMSRWETFPVWDGTTNLNAFNNDLEFSFSFGQYGLYSGELEVVRPIVALASLFAPAYKGNGKYIGPYPSKSWMTAEVLMSIYKGVKGAKSVFDKVSEGNESSGISNVLDSVYTSYESMMQEITSKAESDEMRMFYIKMGNMEAIGPFYVKQVQWDFDFTNLDEFGWPSAGTIHLKDVATMTMATSDQIRSFFDADKMNESVTDKSGVNIDSFTGGTVS